MEQRKRPGGCDGLGYYTSWEKSKDNGCIYCGKIASTREHIPSKVFLLEPYPENLPTIPACFKCNNGFSEDEKYTAYFLDLLKRHIYADYSREKQTSDRLKKDKKLHEILEDEIKIIDEKLYYSPNLQRIFRILVKLAKGHAGFDLDYTNFDNSQIEIYYNFEFNMSDNEINVFNDIPSYDIASEIGSRGLLLIQDTSTGESNAIANWHNVQNKQYRYQVSYGLNGCIIVKILIFDFFYCMVTFK